MSSEPKIEKNSLGIPTADFLVSSKISTTSFSDDEIHILQEDVDAFMAKQASTSAVDAIKKLDELHMKYKYLEQNLNYKKAKLNTQIPNFTTDLEVIKFLSDKNVSLFYCDD